jgi:hypothetical protein
MRNITFRSAPEYRSIQDFVKYIIEDDRTEYTHEDLQALNYRLRRRVRDIRQELDSWGLTLATREPDRRVRGFTTSSHDRWFGPGSLKTHGGSGFDPCWD